MLDLALGLDWVLDGVAFLEPEVEPAEHQGKESYNPWEPDVERGLGVHVDVTGILSVLPAQNSFGQQNGD